MWVGEAARRAGVNVQTMRYYERRGLLPKPARRASGYRELPEEAVRIVRFVKRAQQLGFSLDEVEVLLRLRQHSGRNRQQIRMIAERQLRQVGEKIKELERMGSALRTLVSSCRDGGTPRCPLIEALEADGDGDDTRDGWA